jgi:predicted  nucleic acid-binding Zn-ribbon protein
LEALLNLQEHDRAVIAAEAEVNALDPELGELDAMLAKAESDLAAARKGIEDAGTRRVELEGKIETYKQMQEKRRQRLEWVRGAKEASTLMAELDLARSVLAKEEAEWVRSADKVQEAERKAAEMERALSELQQGQTARREEIGALKAERLDALKVAKTARQAAAQGVDKNLLVRYDRIRRGKAPLAVYQLHGEACGHCFTAIPKHRRQDIMHAQQVGTCEACGVLIYHAVS